MTVETVFSSRKLRIDYMKEGSEKVKSMTLTNLDKNANNDQVVQIVNGVKPLINGTVVAFYLTEVERGTTEA
ncbi:DUF1659 domain-containing protein [Lactobacillus taiwanensis]|uniref:DUF1659 domain-containing protein n=1 Tax=Lactobacillus taiwanensis TaxID=508451 RepID=UPI000B990921|nr:hypothetical protein [Lactobacillus taiwanensis]OYR96273.1 hypothetical protein CBF51_06060 [Lactobacillus taiwanensis]OYS01345.1 hypothetical protein CBF61_05570 [Lactobacillus taiwanensis]OYS14024.1 hypothetical protein CBF69_08015 [Lactobacillus taiwanensis]OYS19583.1 hypothetical protein CBF49_03860 [Lactobacillus taiwanensis]OYS20605.1 hypothetical protein CBF56_00765 [Lactobacillus taiwanensis]